MSARFKYLNGVQLEYLKPKLGLGKVSETPRTDAIEQKARDLYPLSGTNTEWWHRYELLRDEMRKWERELEQAHNDAGQPDAD